MIRRKPREDSAPNPLEITKPENRTNQIPPQKPNLNNQTLGSKPCSANYSEQVNPTQGQQISRGPQDSKHLAAQPQEANQTHNIGTKPKAKPPTKPKEQTPKNNRKNQTSKKPQNNGSKQQTLFELFNSPSNLNPNKPTQETKTKYKGNQTNVKPNPEAQNQTNARPPPYPETTNRTVTPDYDNCKPPDTDKTSKQESEPKPNLTKDKPPKLKTKVVHVGDIKLFLAAKKKERELNMKLLRENDENILLNNPSDRSIATLHPIQPDPLLHSASGSSENYPALHRTAESGNQKFSANPDGTTDLSGDLVLADSCKNLG